MAGTRAFAAAAAALLAGCGGPAAPAAASAVSGEIAVSVATSLAGAFETIAGAFEARHPGTHVALNSAGSPALAAQILEHCPADVFASADAANMARIVAAGRTLAAPAEFARNGLAIVVARDNPKRVRGLEDLAREDLRVALCAPAVPAGAYARAALWRAQVTVVSRSDEPNVAALVAKVALGELDAAVAYATDARRGDVTTLPVAAAHDVVASCSIAALASGANRAGAAAFVAFVRGEPGRAILRRHGFELP